MSPGPEEIRATVERYFAAMRRGAEAEDEMMTLFAEDAVYVEPFGGEPRTSVGVDAIRATMRAGWENPIPDLKLVVHRIEVSEGSATSWWTCESPSFPMPVSGRDTYEVVDGKITRLTVELEAPGG